MNTAGRGRVRHVTGYDSHGLHSGWEFGASPPDAIQSPDDLEAAGLDWTPTTVPCTVASALRAAGRWSLDAAPRRFDAEDWWFRTTFGVEAAAIGEQLWLIFDGLATVADVWLNGQWLARHHGMFTAFEHRVDDVVRADNALVVCFRSLDTLLRQRRPRPRWRAPMVADQQLRWFRTTLLGRTPGWSPPAAPVGPWKPVRIERRRGITVGELRLHAEGDGSLQASCEVESLDGSRLLGAEIVVTRSARAWRADLDWTGVGDRLAGQLTISNVEQWWPHTHGPSPLYDAALHVRHSAGTSVIDVGTIGFRSVNLDTRNGDFSVRVNDLPIFCRGACWTPIDPVSLGEPAAVGEAIDQVVTAGMNMLRVGGTMVYESDEFLDTCDRQGVLLWHDLMFANMDYPDDNPEFVAAVHDEVTQQLRRLQGRPAAAVLCGNSEGEQQASMFGAAREQWSPALFHQQLAGLSHDLCPGVPYTPSSAHGGAFPHQSSIGASSYYGVGAYRRGLNDARRAEVRFASECLAFAHIPAATSLDASPLRGAKSHTAAWKARVPRDLGAGWDFDDVRDHYLSLLFQRDPVDLRSTDHDRYLSLGRVSTGEVLAHVFGEWRRQRSITRGGLVWFLRDLWMGAGWGVIDASGAPKPAWYYLRRALAPRALFISDEGTNGLALHVVNDAPSTLTGRVDVSLFRQGDVRVDQGSVAVTVARHAAIEMNGVEFFPGFHDLSYAFRFGPPAYDVACATLYQEGMPISRAFHFPCGHPPGRVLDVGITATAVSRDDGSYELTVRARQFAQSVEIEVDGWRVADNYFHVAPNETVVTLLERRATADTAPRGRVQPLNAEAGATIVVDQRV